MCGGVGVLSNYDVIRSSSSIRLWLRHRNTHCYNKIIDSNCGF